ncbi:indolepyruvate oxidoreductase subunit beta [Thermanaeromonas sp. C210]|uniref:indolepyruvate oxidoreductase subunit beta n=1 Tax=Thermanaeromonas sp. C210 TaxID=2731925 RepID=UPI00155B4092|nr:indolepyruvate oxidoreductase subunit beta [Thermanaeromonas sp. C210]GFN23990.1 pyruvate:ferredoxin (flavodoxin) oxidoreductase [Thermanaeromonas sp. C210]
MNIVIAGVGGQGIILASRALAEAALNAGLSVRTAETIGMAQREGAVASYVRIGVSDYGPLIPQGTADILVACEPAEGARHIAWLRRGGRAVIATSPVIPVSVSLGTSSYDVGAVLRFLEEAIERPCFLDAAALAREAGSIKALNMVMLGALSRLDLPLAADELLKAALKLLPPQVQTINRHAFALGRQAMEGL